MLHRFEPIRSATAPVRSFLKAKKQETRSRPSQIVSKSISLLKDVDTNIFDKLTEPEKENLRSQLSRLSTVVEHFDNMVSDEGASSGSGERIVTVVTKKSAEVNNLKPRYYIAKRRVDEPMVNCLSQGKSIANLSVTLEFELCGVSSGMKEEVTYKAFFIDDNNEIISDSIGPFTSSKILATRHIKTDFAEKIGLKNLKSVAVLTPNVLGKTGIEAAETVLAVVNKIKPDLVIVIDALCASGCENLFSVIQFSNSGISPGSGVKNARKELSFYTLGVPTLAIGVPTVVEAKSIVKNYVNFDDFNIDLLLTPKDTDLLCHKMSDVLARSLNVFLQPMIDKETLISLV